MYGMVEAFNTQYPCRICSMELVQTRVATKEDPTLIRTNFMEGIDHAKEMSAPNDATLNPKLSVGFRKKSELNNFKHFKAETGSSVDPFHDICEGTCRKDLCKVCNHMVTKMGISEDEIRRDIEQYDFGCLNHAHKPSNFKLSAANLGQSGCQIKTLLMHFPLIFGKYFHKRADLKILDLVKTLIRITNLAFKRVITDEDIADTESLVEFYLSSLLQLFPGTTLSPKHHYLTHYGRIMRRLGPLGHFSTAAHESKHTFFTGLIEKSSLNRNVIKTLAVRHQNAHATNLIPGLKLEVVGGKAQEVSLELAAELRDKFNISSDGYQKISWISLIFKFAPHLFFRHTGLLYEIIYILKNPSGKYFLACAQWTFEDDEMQCWSELIKKIGYSLIAFDDVGRLQTFNKAFSTQTKAFCVLY